MSPKVEGAIARRGGLREIREAAGFPTARGFAEAIGMKPSTYVRYEQDSGTPDCGIPVKSAWHVADALRCTIDDVCGRADLWSEPGAVVRRRYERLGARGRRKLEEYLLFLEQRELMDGRGADAREGGEPAWAR